MAVIVPARTTFSGTMRRPKAIRSVRPLIRFQALPIRMAKVLVLIPPPVLPLLAPMNISAMVRKMLALLMASRSRVPVAALSMSR
mgnify:CR=1 FL=1